MIYVIPLFTILGCSGTGTYQQNSEETEIDQTKYMERFINNSYCDQVIDKEFLYVCYDYNLKVAKSVAYTLYGDLVNELNIKKRPSFYEEESIDVSYRAKVSDYSKSGYDRGHMAPDAAFDWSQESLDSTYSLSNIIPQIPEVNQKAWVKVEKYARDKAIELFELSVVNLVKYDNIPDRIGKSSIAVSVGYYKILYNLEEKYEECFYYPNNKEYNFDSDIIDNHRIDCNLI